jgi:hypothetical protein
MWEQTHLTPGNAGWFLLRSVDFFRDNLWKTLAWGFLYLGLITARL